MTEKTMPDDVLCLLMEYTRNSKADVERFIGAAKACGYELIRADLSPDREQGGGVEEIKDLKRQLKLAQYNFEWYFTRFTAATGKTPAECEAEWEKKNPILYGYPQSRTAPDAPERVEVPGLAVFKPVMQTVLGSRGNCMSACFASLFGLNIEQVPNFFDKSENDDHWWELVRDWLEGRGFGIITIAYKQDYMEKVGGIHIVGGMSARNVHHAVLYKDGKLLHDPHPDKTGIEPETWDLIFPLVRRPLPSRAAQGVDSEIIKIRIADIKNGIARAKQALMNNETRLIDIWLLTLADQIKSLEHAYLTPRAGEQDGGE